LFTCLSHRVTNGVTAGALLAVVSATFLVLGYQAAGSDAPTYDEPLYVASGLLALDRGDLWINDEHPPIAKVLAALPAVLAGTKLPVGRPDQRQEHSYTAAFVRQLSVDRALKSVTFESRLLPLAITVAIALAVALLAAELFGSTAGFLAGCLWLASPLVLGLGHLDGVDVPFTGAVILFSLTLLRWLREPNRRRLLPLAIACGLTALTDVDGLLLVALAGVLVFLNTPQRSHRPRVLGTLAAGVIITVWIPYVLIALVSLHPAALSPVPYIQGLKFALGHNSGSAPSYLLGHAWTGTYLPFWPGSLLLKLPLPTVLILLAAPIACWRLPAGQRREVLLVVLAPALLILLFDLPQPRDIGIRYLLPVIALWCVGAVALATPARRNRFGSAALGLAVAFALVTMIGARHNSLAWTDPIFGPGYQAATNSNLDWGQDLYPLRQWVDHHPGARVDYFGTPGLTIPRSRPLDGVAPDTISGWAAASATTLTTYSDLAWLRAYCPVAVLDQTILIYHFGAPPTPSPGPAKPAGLCHSPLSHRI
jgi:4-amino-4-deoxy-L-arabinose transferase-like glycosyltransferase